MRFGRTPEQHAFSEALDDLLGAADVSSASRAWAAGDHSAGLKLWQRLAELGVTGLLVPEEHGGVGAGCADLAVAFERLGYHGVPGPWIESVAVAPQLLEGSDATTILSQVASGESIVTVAAPGGPYALDADIASKAYGVFDDMVIELNPGATKTSVDPQRRLFVMSAGYPITGRIDPSRARDLGTLACSAQLLGAGLRLLDDSVAYVKQRTQFGRPVGEFQAVKHLLADVRVALDFAAPLVHNAAVELDAGTPTAGRAVSAAKVAAGDAAYLASRTALQVHGAIGYTREFDLSLWILKVRALVGAWGTPAEHRARILESLVEAR
ncbi:acyl-CoA dehydrogenase family protein [Nocardioides luteus]|uniref:Acyl-CoA dehydrogenase n=1 Tax=Nocardioides luteus TaxID=1844 RepID=A0A1J4N9M9_9ACTN|nr:acyl-CoA dehydrogenase family protein [Nocardioides luteus]OIJ27352.1 acyl-CoA dehydrogenase [Nocardioides luteus]